MMNGDASPAANHKRYFFEKFGITERLLERCLGEALSAGGDYADLYFESVMATALGVDEQIVKSASQGTSAGCGVRVLSGERTGYAYTDNLSPERLLHAARTAALIASGPAKQPVQGFVETPSAELYPMPVGGYDLDLAARLELILRADRAARAFDARIVQVRASYSEELRRVLIAASDGAFASDTQPLCRLNVFAIAKEGAVTTKGAAGGGGRAGLDQFQGSKGPEALAREAARGAILQLGAVPAPAGEMEVVLGPGWPGILLHEAVGHGLEADFNRKKTSAFTGLIGQPVASPKVTVVDNGTMAGRRGSLNVDDEGTPTQETVLIEGGVLKGYLSDKLSARLMGMANTGSGRRESYQAIPMPRMTNTYMLAGDDAPEDILRSVKRGLYAVNFGGGQVDITNGKFVFSASEAYLIEDGKVTAPVRDATLIGNGPEALKYVSMVGNDLKLDEGIGTCGKDGQ
ncbi:MAG TPA: metalloprotease TldD, partial [Terracidiphilus sp.]|nr:metalloprotease TldD [Terracidiphilus sp.]